MSAGEKGIAAATWQGIMGRMVGPRRRPELARMTGRRVVVTGANSGLGQGVAAHLCRLGAEVIMAGRTLDEGARRAVARAGSGPVWMEHLDLASFASVEAFAARMARQAPLHGLVLNAAVITAAGCTTADGLDEMWQVNVLSNVLLVERLLATGCLDTATAPAPRVVFVSSEAHRWSRGVDLQRLGVPLSFGMKEALGHYGDTKLVLAAYAAHLTRRLSAEASPVAVHTAFLRGLPPQPSGGDATPSVSC